MVWLLAHAMFVTLAARPGAMSKIVVIAQSWPKPAKSRDRFYVESPRFLHERSEFSPFEPFYVPLAHLGYAIGGVPHSCSYGVLCYKVKGRLRFRTIPNPGILHPLFYYHETSPSLFSLQWQVRIRVPHQYPCGTQTNYHFPYSISLHIRFYTLINSRLGQNSTLEIRTRTG